MSLLLAGAVDDGKLKLEAENGESERTKRVSNATDFLLDPRVKQTPTSNKVHFLKSKGLSAEEVCEAFVKVGQPKALEEVRRIFSERPYVPNEAADQQRMPQPLVNNSGDAASAAQTSHQRRHVSSLYAPQAPPLPEETAAARGVDWRDLVIAAGAAVMAGFAALKAFQVYSPYEIRLKEERVGKTRPKRGRRGGRHLSSDSDMERPFSCPVVPALPTPAAPAASEAIAGGSQAEIERLKTELKETQEALEAEKKSKAELSVTLGKLRGQVTAYTRTNERQESLIKSLREELDKIKGEAEAKENPDKAADDGDIDEAAQVKEEDTPIPDVERKYTNEAFPGDANDSQQNNSSDTPTTDSDDNESSLERPKLPVSRGFAPTQVTQRGPSSTVPEGGKSIASLLQGTSNSKAAEVISLEERSFILSERQQCVAEVINMVPSKAKDSVPLCGHTQPQSSGPKHMSCGSNVASSQSHRFNVNGGEEKPAPDQRAKPKRKVRLAELYYYGVAQRKRVEERLERLRASNKELKNCTFRPTITQLARTLDRPKESPYDHRQDVQLRQRALLEAWKSKLEKECRPAPKISKGSEIIVRRVRSNSTCVIPVADRLYMDSARRQYRRREEEEEEAEQRRATPLRRSASDVKALIDRLYEYEEKRMTSIQRKRYELWSDTRPRRRCEDTDGLVERLYRPARRKHSPEVGEPPSFSPHVNEATRELSCRARRRRLERWHRLWLSEWRGCGEKDECQLINHEHLIVLKKIDEVVMASGLTRNCAIDEFCAAMRKYEKDHGMQEWSVTPLPLKSYVNEDLTFSPATLPVSKEREGSLPAHQRLFDAAKAKQAKRREEEQRKREEDPREEALRKARPRHLSRKSSKRLDAHCAEEGETSVCPLSPGGSVSITDSFCSYRFVELSSLSSSDASEGALRAVSPPPVWVTPHFIEVAESLQKLIDETRDDRDSPDGVTPERPASIAAEGDGFKPKQSCVRRKKKKNRRVGELIPDELLLECAASRLSSFSSSVAARNRERLENKRRLRRVGKILYHRM